MLTSIEVKWRCRGGMDDSTGMEEFWSPTDSFIDDIEIPTDIKVSVVAGTEWTRISVHRSFSNEGVKKFVLNKYEKNATMMVRHKDLSKVRVRNGDVIVVHLNDKENYEWVTVESTWEEKRHDK
jgi:hypothetical protein